MYCCLIKKSIVGILFSTSGTFNTLFSNIKYHCVWDNNSRTTLMIENYPHRYLYLAFKLLELPSVNHIGHFSFIVNGMQSDLYRLEKLDVVFDLRLFLDKKQKINVIILQYCYDFDNQFENITLNVRIFD